MSLIDQLGVETTQHHAATDETLLFGSPARPDYRHYLTRMYGFVLPVERAILASPGIERFVEPARFHKHELLRRDLGGLRLSAEQIGMLLLATVPVLETPEAALGWAYLIERSTLQHGDLYRHLARALPGDIAFSSNYLKCYVGLVGEMWRAFGFALEPLNRDLARREQLIEGAKAAFAAFGEWRRLHDRLAGIPAARPPAEPETSSDA
jgi:heme oxygenase